MPKIASNPIKGILGIENQIKKEMQAKKKANKKVLAKVNHDNIPITEHIKQY